MIVTDMDTERIGLSDPMRIRIPAKAAQHMAANGLPTSDHVEDGKSDCERCDERHKAFKTAGREKGFFHFSVSFPLSILRRNAHVNGSRAEVINNG